MNNILKEHYLMFCASEFNEDKFTKWALSLETEDLVVILQQTNAWEQIYHTGFDDGWESCEENRELLNKNEELS